MGKQASKGQDDQRGKSTKKKSADQSIADDADLSTKAPSRVHIFPGKSRPVDSSQPDDQKRDCSSLPSAPPTIFAGIQSPITDLGKDLATLSQWIQQGKKALYEAAMKAEDLEAIIQGLKQTRDRFSKSRQSACTTTGRAHF